MREIDEVCLKFGVADVKGLEALNRAVDQSLMRSDGWDYLDHTLQNNLLHRALLCVNKEQLTRDELWRVNQMIWLWYHHAISCAIWRHRDREAAQDFSLHAVVYQRRISNHPNKITRLLFLLVRDRFYEAEAWAKKIKSPRYERKTALKILEKYRRGEFF